MEQGLDRFIKVQKAFYKEALEADPQCEVFQKVLDKFFDGEKDQKTIDICYNN